MLYIYKVYREYYYKILIDKIKERMGYIDYIFLKRVLCLEFPKKLTHFLFEEKYEIWMVDVQILITISDDERHIIHNECVFFIFHCYEFERFVRFFRRI